MHGLVTGFQLTLPSEGTPPLLDGMNVINKLRNRNRGAVADNVLITCSSLHTES